MNKELESLRQQEEEQEWREQQKMLLHEAELEYQEALWLEEERLEKLNFEEKRKCYDDGDSSASITDL